jgi:hypothetical protein
MKVVSLFLLLALSAPGATTARAAPHANASISAPQYMILRVTYTRNSSGFIPHLALVLSSNKAVAQANGFSMAEKDQVRYSNSDGTMEILKNEVDVLNKAAEVGWTLQSIETATLPNGYTAHSYILAKE